MSPPFFRGFVLLGLLFLWVTPTEQGLNIMQKPKPAVIGQPVALIIVNIQDPLCVHWFKGEMIHPRYLIAGTVNGTQQTGEEYFEGVTVYENGTLVIDHFRLSFMNQYTAQVQDKKKDKGMYVGTSVLRGSSSSVISSVFLLFAAVTISALRLL